MALNVRAMTCREEREGQIVADRELFEGKNRVAARAAAPRSSHMACHRARPPPCVSVEQEEGRTGACRGARHQPSCRNTTV